MKIVVVFILLLLINTIALPQDRVRCFQLEQYLKQTKNNNEWIFFFVKTNDKSGLMKKITAVAGKYKGSVRSWHYIAVKRNQINEFLDKVNIQNLNFKSYQGVALNDTMRVNNKINAIHAGQQPLGVSYEGLGVVVGFIDTGIDWQHPDFLNPQDSSTRVLAIWDQTQPVNSFTPSEYGYGQLWDSAQIMQGLSNNNDQYGHGSTVAGTACGNAFANGLNKGVAPKTELIVVESNFNASNWLGTVADAVHFIYHLADSLGKPCVINASLGTYLGSHDGLDPYALYIDSLINQKKGHLMVAAAGNSGSLGNYHLHTENNQDTAFTWFLTNPSSIYGANSIFFELWADTADFNDIQFRMGADKVNPVFENRSLGTFFTIQNNLGGVTYDTLRNAQNQILATVEYWSELRDGQYLLQVYLPSPDSAQYHFRFETTGTGKFDCWSSSIFGLSDIVDYVSGVSNFTDISKYSFPDSLQTIVSSFQCLPSVIAVGNYYNDSGYVNLDTTWTSNGGIRGKIAETSSRGPTRDGRLKPEIAASGHGVNSAMPLNLINYYLTHPPLDSTLAIGGMHRRNGGTSMASPIVAGVGALALEKCNQLTPERFKQALITTAYSDTFTGQLPNVSFGNGKLDGFNTLNALRFTVNVAGDLSFCEGDSTVLTLSETFEQYNWNATDTLQNWMIDSSGLYFVQAADTSGCWSDTTFVQVVEYPNPQTPTIAVNLDSIILTNVGNTNVQWYLDGNPITSSLDSIVIAQQNGDYYAILENNFGCQSYSDTIMFLSTGVKQEQQQFFAYPNPVQETLYIKTNTSIHRFEVTDLRGRIVQSFDNLSVNEINVDVSKLVNGIYQLKLYTYNEMYVKKILVKH